jgi:hypothetical protein
MSTIIFTRLLAWKYTCKGWRSCAGFEGKLEMVNQNADLNGELVGDGDWAKAARELRTPNGRLISVCGRRVGMGDVSSKPAPF